MLMNLIYSSITLNQGKVTFTYSRAFQILAKAVEAMNSSKLEDLVKLPKSIFELPEKISPTLQSSHYLPAYTDVRNSLVWYVSILIATPSKLRYIVAKIRYLVLIAQG